MRHDFDGTDLPNTFLSPAHEVESGVFTIGVALDVRPAVRLFTFCFQSRAGRRMCFYNFAHTHPLAGVDGFFGVFEISPTQLADHRP